MLSARFALLFLALPALPLSAPAANVPPKTVGAISAATLFRGAAAERVDLSTFFTDPDTIGVRLTTELGTIDVALYQQAAPLTVANFLHYVNSGRYLITDPTTGDPAPIFFHRAVVNFILQSGGFVAGILPDNSAATRAIPVETFPPIVNEFGISNTRGTIAMAKVNDLPDSATSQWFINLADNSANLDTQNGGFTVFGRVVGNGMTVANAIATLPIFNFGAPFDALPVRNYTLADFNAPTAVGPNNIITVPAITRTTPLIFTATSDHPALASVAIRGSTLLVTPKALGSALITATATDVDGAKVSQTFQVTIVSYPVHLANISTRVVVGANDDALIGGFIVLGNAPKRVAIRALGPSLADAGLTGVLGNPTLELHDGTGAMIDSNDNWEDAPNEQEIIDVGLAPTKPNESVLLRNLPATNAGSTYTAVIRGAGGGGGFGLVEVYDLASGPGASVVNISTRGEVKTGDNVMIGGFIIFGDGSQRVLVRALGPSLADAGIADPLGDPTLTLVNSQGVQVDFNDDWQDNPVAAEIEASTVAPTDPKESAVLETLAPDNYTAIVRGVGPTGTGLVEVYALPPDA